ncbi:MAG: aldo/keto reductase [Planctomycetota bacterium]
MLYRRFGRTGIQMPVFTCGAMRYQQSWNDKDAIVPESQANVEACVRRAFELGINHVETARGYGTSEEQLGRVLPKLPRGKLILQTKVGPEAEPKKFLENFERSMALLKADYLDLFALHGINNEERLAWSVRQGGCLEAALQLKKQGRVRFVGFSSHAGNRVLLPAISDGRFDFVNLHWYYVNPFNWPAVQAATKQNMGVLIISPNDKGGKLYQPPPKLVQLCAPLSPIVFNNLWCLVKPEAHTLSIGAARPTDYDEHMKTLACLAPGAHPHALLRTIEARLHDEMVKTLGREWVENWHVGLPEWDATPGQVNIFEILRLRNFVKAFDMLEFGKMRYNLLGNADHWFPGNKAGKLNGLDFSQALKDSPFAAQIPAALAEAHALLSGEEVKRLGKH